MERVKEGDILDGKFRVERVLGVGGMGFVVAAHHLHLDTKVAIKSLLPQGASHPDAIARFEREARAAAKIKSEHIGRVLDVARFEDGTPYLVMEHLEGCDLAGWLETRGPLPIEQAVDFVVQACEAIAEAHTLGIVHRDLKPANLFVVRGRDGLFKVKVLDFGIAKTEESRNDRVLTGTQSVLGSPEYMSPEQFSAPKTVDWRTDIWSIGVTLFELLAGRGPFTANELFQIVVKVTQEPTPPIALFRHAVPAGLSSVIARCLDKDRFARYRDVAELVNALSPFAPPHTRPLIERIGRIVRESEASRLPATVLADTLPAHVATPPAWPTTARPFVMTIPPPPTTNVNSIALAVGIAAAALTTAACLLLGAPTRSRPSEPASAAAPPASIASAEVAVDPPTPAPVLSSEPSPKPKASAAATVFRGTHGVTRATWRVGGGVYSAVIHTNGSTGYADVNYVEPSGPVVVRETLALKHGPRGWAYVGSNPRYSDDDEPAKFFTPNVFFMDHAANGAWSFTETCAVGTGACTRVIEGN